MNDTQQVTRDDIKTLLGRSSLSGVLSVHVGQSASERNDPQRWLSAVRSGLKELLHRHSGNKEVAKLVEAAQEEISQLPLEARRRNLVYYRSLDPDWSYWRSLQLYLPDFFAYDHSPQVRFLVALLDETPLLGVAVVSQDRVRLLTWQDGTMEENAEIRLSDLEEEVGVLAGKEGKGTLAPGTTRTGGVPKSRVADHVRRWYSHVAQRIGEAGSRYGWQRLLLVGTSATTGTVSEALPDSWKRLQIPGLDRNLIKASEAELGVAAGQQMHEWKRMTELSEVEEIIDDARSGRRASTGIEMCLEHLHERRVDRLFVCGDLQMSGFRDDNGKLYLRAPRLASGEALRPEPRLVERMIVSAMEAGASVIPLEGESARRLSLMGGVAARLRWKDTTGGGEG